MSGVCVILAGGLGTRLKSVTGDLPKCLAPIGGIPFIIRQMEELSDQGVNRFVLALGHAADVVVKRIAKENFRFEVISVVEPRALGTGGAMLNAFNAVGISESNVVNGDTLIEGDISSIFSDLDLSTGEFVRLAGINVADRHRFGGLEVEGNRVVSFVEKGVSGGGFINSGCYRVNIKAFDGLSCQERFSFEDSILAPLVARKNVGFVPIDGRMIDIGIPDDYNKLNSIYV